MNGKNDFLEKYSITTEKFDESGLNWNDLVKIYEDHQAREHLLSIQAQAIANQLQLLKSVHSVKWRIKNPEHLIEKIIRKALGETPVRYSIDDYRENITDLIGLRALHLFKEEWQDIHEFITKTWDLKEPPTAFIRTGDPKSQSEHFVDSGCEVKEHPFGYRSVHYIIKCQPSKELIYVEIQVRTIFEEGWSEIDHRIRYPYDIDNPILGQFLAVFNRLAGSADEMGTFIQSLKQGLDERDADYKRQLLSRDKTISELQAKLAKPSISKRDKDEMNELLTILQKQKFKQFELKRSNYLTRIDELNRELIKSRELMKKYQKT